MNFCHDGSFHDTECGNNELVIIINIKSFSLRLHKFSLCHVMNEQLKPEDSRDELINSLSGSD